MEGQRNEASGSSRGKEKSGKSKKSLDEGEKKTKFVSL